MPLPVIDTRTLFRPLCHDIVARLRALSPDDWERPTLARSWRVRDVAAHLCDTALRRLSLHRDRPASASTPSRGLSDRELLDVITELNASWVRVAGRFSPRVLTDLYAHASGELVAFIETLDPLAEAVWPVSWAGQSTSPQWLDIGREFTEIWHHGSQIRDASGAGPFPDARWLAAVLQVSMHALPHTYRDVRPRDENASLVIDITGPASGRWTLRRDGERWDISEGGPDRATTTITMDDETAWRLLFNALSPHEAQTSITLRGDLDLARPLFEARAVIV